MTPDFSLLALILNKWTIGIVGGLALYGLFRLVF